MLVFYLGGAGTASPRSAVQDSVLGVRAFAADSGMFHVGEELIYNASYAFIDIGQIRVKVLDKVTTGETSYYRTIAYIDSYSGVPFVNLHSIYESNIRDDVVSLWFRSREENDSQWAYTVYDFRYDERRLVIQKGIWGSRKIDSMDTLSVDTLQQDGLSLYYLARQHLRSGQILHVPIVVKEKSVSTDINFYNKRTSAQIGAVKYPVDVIEFDGTARFIGLYGLTGDFQGWFSNDEARIPIVARMKVIIGSIKLELMKWKRDGWDPPRYVESTSK
jgi:hypothetical protein